MSRFFALALVFLSLSAFAEDPSVTVRRATTVVNRLSLPADLLKFESAWSQKIEVTKAEFKRRTNGNWTANFVISRGGKTEMWLYHDGGFVQAPGGTIYRVRRSDLPAFAATIGIPAEKVPPRYSAIESAVGFGGPQLQRIVDEPGRLAFEDVIDGAETLSAGSVAALGLQFRFDVVVTENGSETKYGYDARGFLTSSTGLLGMWTRLQRIRPDAVARFNHRLGFPTNEEPPLLGVTADAPRTVLKGAPLATFAELWSRKHKIKIERVNGRDPHWMQTPPKGLMLDSRETSDVWHYYPIGVAIFTRNGQAYQLSFADTVALNRLLQMGDAVNAPVVHGAVLINGSSINPDVQPLRVNEAAKVRALEDYWLIRQPAPDANANFRYVVWFEIGSYQMHWYYDPRGFVAQNPTGPVFFIPAERVAELNVLLGIPCHSSLEAK